MTTTFGSLLFQLTLKVSLIITQICISEPNKFFLHINLRIRIKWGINMEKNKDLCTTGINICTDKN